MSWTVLGLIAGLMCMTGFVPQIWQGYKTKKLDDLSYFLNSFLGFGMLLWIFYGIHIHSLPVILTNCIGVTLNVVLIIMKSIYSN